MKFKLTEPKSWWFMALVSNYDSIQHCFILAVNRNFSYNYSANLYEISYYHILDDVVSVVFIRSRALYSQPGKYSYPYIYIFPVTLFFLKSFPIFRMCLYIMAFTRRYNPEDGEVCITSRYLVVFM